MPTPAPTPLLAAATSALSSLFGATNLTAPIKTAINAVASPFAALLNDVQKAAPPVVGDPVIEPIIDLPVLETTQGSEIKNAPAKTIQRNVKNVPDADPHALAASPAAVVLNAEPPTRPAAQSNRAEALAHAAQAANPRAVIASGKTPGPNQHALDALAKKLPPTDVLPNPDAASPAPPALTAEAAAISEVVYSLTAPAPVPVQIDNKALPAAQSNRSDALTHAAQAANPRAVVASDKTPGPNQHALDALLKHAPVESASHADALPITDKPVAALPPSALVVSDASTLSAPITPELALPITAPASSNMAHAFALANHGRDTLPAAKSSRADALAAATVAANPRAQAVVESLPGPNQHALSALLKHAAGDGADASTLTPSTVISTPTSTTPFTPAPTLELATTGNVASLSGDAVLDPPDSPTPDVHSDEFSEDIGAKLTWLADRKIGHAQIKVAPPELGAVDVRLRIDGDKVSIDFSSTNPEVRTVLESSLPRLRELFEAQGLRLHHADVGHGQRGRDGHAGGPPNDHGHGCWDVDGEAGEGRFDFDNSHRPVRLGVVGLLDEYA